MGAIRGFFLVIILVLFFLSLLLVNFFWTLSLSLNYENVERESTAIIQDFFSEVNVTSIIDKNYPIIQLYCQNNSNYVFSEEGYTFDISCNSILEGKDAVIEEGIKNIVYDIYYKDYDCNFLDCFQNSEIPLFLISKKARDFWANKFYFSLAISFVLLILIFLLIEKKTNMPILVGSLLIVSSLPFIKLDSLMALFSDKTLFKFLKLFFSESFSVSIKVLITGIILLVIGIVLKIFKVGFFISNLISKFKDKSKIKKKEKSVQGKVDETKKEKIKKKSKSK